MILSTKQITDGLKTFLTGLKLTDDPEAAALFETVEVAESTNFLENLKRLSIVDNKVCLIVPGDDRNQTVIDGRNIKTKRETDFLLLIADRAVMGAEDALLSDGGVLAMKDRVQDRINGLIVGGSAICLVADGEPASFSDGEKDDDPGRSVWIQTITVQSGYNRRAASQ